MVLHSFFLFIEPSDIAMINYNTKSTSVNTHCKYFWNIWIRRSH